jgi:hypothetical protein
LTFLTASSTVLMHDTLAVKSVWSKPVLLLADSCLFLRVGVLESR